MSGTLDVAVVGATGLVGGAMLEILEQREYPVGRIYPLASARSAGRRITFRGEEVEVGDLAEFDFGQARVALFSAGGHVSDVHAPRAAAAGCVVIDNTSRFRYDDDIPLVVPEVNADAIAEYRNRNIIANPNCSTIQMVTVLKPIHDEAGIERVNVATYQSVSGAGSRAVTALREDTGRALNGVHAERGAMPPTVAFNAVPHIDRFEDNGYTREEMKMVWETQKILSDPRIKVNATAVRVPVFFAHSEAIHLETREKLSAAAARELLASAPGVVVVDDGNSYPTALTHAGGADPVFVGRIREDISHERGLDLWVVADNIRKGAALNSVQIAETLADYYL